MVPGDSCGSELGTAWVMDGHGKSCSIPFVARTTTSTRVKHCLFPALLERTRSLATPLAEKNLIE